MISSTPLISILPIIILLLLANIYDYFGHLFFRQDDIMYAELTVKENLLFAGRFKLPAGTPESEIEDLADKVMASLGLSRIANSRVGDVNRRGVSGGEKKRVNIGIELMAKPKILFLDEPTRYGFNFLPKLYYYSRFCPSFFFILE